MTAAPATIASTALRQADDDALLAAIARRQDGQAFSELYERHQHAAFNLALHLTGKHELAEEAVQEAMADVWRSAASYRPGKARSWVLRIVANASLKILRGKRRRKEMATAEVPEEPLFDESSPEHDAERSELLVALRECVGRLPAINRRLVALYYVAGFSQEEIGQELALPARTVSFKIEETLQQLRDSLSRAGFASGAALLGAEGLREVICSGDRAPEGLLNRVIENMQSAAEQSQRLATAGTAGFKATHAFLALAVVATAGVGYWWSAQEPVAAPQPAAVAKVPEQPSASPAEAFRARWDFSAGATKDIAVLQGAWNWNAKGHMEPEGLNSICLLFPQRVPAKPMVMTIQTLANPGRMGIDAIWIGPEQVLPYKDWHATSYMKQAENEYRVVIVDNLTLHYMNGKIMLAHEYERPYPAERLGLIVTRWMIRKIDLREMSAEEHSAFDPQRELKKLQQMKDCKLDMRPGATVPWDRVPPEFR